VAKLLSSLRAGQDAEGPRPRRFRSLTRATLYRIGAGVTAIIARSTAVTY